MTTNLTASKIMRMTGWFYASGAENGFRKTLVSAHSAADPSENMVIPKMAAADGAEQRRPYMHRPNTSDLNDAHTCGEEDAAFQAARTQRSGSLGGH